MRSPAAALSGFLALCWISGCAAPGTAAAEPVVVADTSWNARSLHGRDAGVLIACLKGLAAELGGKVTGGTERGEATISTSWPPYECDVSLAWRQDASGRHLVSARAERNHQGAARELVRRLAFEMSRRGAAAFAGPSSGFVVPQDLGSEEELHDSIDTELRRRGCVRIRPAADQEGSRFEGSDATGTVAWSVDVRYRGTMAVVEVVKWTGACDAQDEADTLHAILTAWAGRELEFEMIDL